MNYEEKIKKLAEYIRSGEKSEDEFKIGFEIEHFAVDRQSLETTTYDKAIREILEELLVSVTKESMKMAILWDFQVMDLLYL